MGQLAIWLVFYALIGFALYGAFISKFPAAFLALAAAFVAKFGLDTADLISWGNIAIIVVLCVASMIVNKMAPRWAKKISHYGKGGTWGTIVGSVIALLLSAAFLSLESEALAYTLIILVFLILPFFFAWLFEYISQKQMVPALQSAGAAMVVYVSTTFIKLFAAVYTLLLVFAD